MPNLYNKKKNYAFIPFLPHMDGAKIIQSNLAKMKYFNLKFYKIKLSIKV